MKLITCLLAALLRPAPAEAEQRAPLPARVLPMPVGVLCAGLLPSCARNGDTGIHLRIGMLAGLREDRSVGWVQGDAGFLVSVMRWAELGVYLPVIWFDSAQPMLQPLRIGGKLAFLSPTRWQSLWGSLFTEVRIAKGPFSGEGSPLGEQPTALDLGVTVEGRHGLFHAQGLAWLTGARSELQLHAGAEASFRGETINPFVQARLDLRPGCPPSESPLCGTGGAVVIGLRGSFDAASAAPFAGIGQGSGHASILVGVHTGLSFDVDFVRRHGDGSAEAQAWWERRAASLRRFWGEQFAEREYAPLVRQLERQRAELRSLDERPSARLDELPRPEDALHLWRDAVGGEATAFQELLHEPLAASTIAELRQAISERRTRLMARLHGRCRPPLRRDAEGYPQLALGDAGLAWERLIAEQGALLQELERERRQREEAQRIPYKPLVLPPMEKIALNAAALAPFELLAAFYMGSPEGVAQMALIRRDLRPMAYTEEEREIGEAMEAAYQTMFAVGTSLAEGTSRAMGIAARRGAVRAIQTEMATVVTRAEPITGEGLLGRLNSRLNPFNYAFEGLGSNFGNVRFRPPKGISMTLPEASGAMANGEAVHLQPMIKAPPTDLPKIPRLQIEPRSFKQKWTKHHRDWSLDPADPEARQWLQKQVHDIAEHPDEVRHGAWHPTAGGGSDYFFFRRESDIVLTTPDGEFVTVLRNATENSWYKKAIPVK